MTTALVCGVTGQDGAYLARHLLGQGYQVIGSSRDAQMSNLSNLAKLDIQGRVTLVSMAPSDFRSVLQVLEKTRPNEIYNLAGQSSVALSFEQPVETLESVTLGTLNLLECIRFLRLPCRLYNAGSGECFGDTGEQAAHESTPFRPRSPYAVAKAAAFWEVANYREAYDIFACTGILFNHESPLRAERFVTQKIVRAAKRIAEGSTETLRLGNIDISRDWGYAPEYVHAMWLMLQQAQPQDFVIATGRTSTLRDFVASAFGAFELDWERHVEVDPSLFRPSDLKMSRADPSRALAALGWQAASGIQDIIRKMIGGA